MNHEWFFTGQREVKNIEFTLRRPASSKAGYASATNPALVTMKPDRSQPQDSQMDTETFRDSIASASHQVASQDTARKETDNQTVFQIG